MDRNGLAALMAYDDLCARIYNDARATPGTRELLLAIAWACTRDPEVGTNVWPRIATLLGKDRSRTWRHRMLVSADAPRYQPPESCHRGYNGTCEGPRIRPYQPRGVPPQVAARMTQGRDQTVCGSAAAEVVIERDRVTGWHSPHWFCRRHTDQAARVRAQLAALGEPPPPIPNTGGLLPAYFASNWQKVYEWARPGWKPPYHGICADDWPTPGHTPIPRRPRLSLVVGGLDTEPIGTPA